MKRLLSTTVIALALAIPTMSLAAPKKTAAEAASEGAKKAAEKAPAPAAEAAKVAGEGKPIPMYVRVDSIDAKAKTFSMKKKDGVEVKHVVTAATTIMNGDAAAKLEDIKVGEYVSGQRLKKTDTEYEVVKITKFGAAAEKKPKTEGGKPAETKKPN